MIARQHDEMIKYATALRLGTADAEAILRRFTRENTQHPTYKALLELGKAVKTAFLARYLAETDETSSTLPISRGREVRLGSRMPARRR